MFENDEKGEGVVWYDGDPKPAGLQFGNMATRSEISKETGEEVVVSGPLQTEKTPMSQSVLDTLRARIRDLSSQIDAVQNKVNELKRQRAIESGTIIIPSKPFLPARP